MSADQEPNLQRVRQHLEALRQELLQRKSRVHRTLTREQGTSPAGFAGQALEVKDETMLQAIGTATDTELAEVNEALRRVEEGEYGLCRNCGQPISLVQLAAVPQAVNCAMCAH
jgi:DnaK suppressor protein